MAPCSAPALQAEFDRRVLVQVLRKMRDRPVADLLDYIASNRPYAKALGTLTISELHDPSVDAARRAEAKLLRGAAFDRVVLEIVAEAGDWVASGYVKARAGGPRWKVQNALGRLVKAGQLERRGKTSSTQYRRIGGRAS